MDIISRDSKSAKKIRVSIYVIIGAVYFILMALIFVILNTYPAMLSRDMVFASKETALVSRVSVISSTISSLSRFSVANVEQVMQMVDSDDIAVMAVADENGNVIYSAQKDDENIDKYDEYTNMRTISYALQYNDVFVSRYERGLFLSYAAVPITDFEEVLGAVLIFEIDSEQGAMILNLQKDMLKVSVIIFAIVTFSCAVAICIEMRSKGYGTGITRIN